MSSTGQILTLDPFTIDPDYSGRIGLYFPAKADALGALIKRDGQNDPIKVVKQEPDCDHQWRLVAGLHRLQGCLSAGIDVRAIDVTDADDLDAIQASENLDRRDLAPLERAMFVRCRADIARARVMKEHGVKSQQELAGKARAAKAAKVQYSDIEKADEAAVTASDNLSLAYGWTDEVAEICGFGKREVQRSLRIFRCIIEPFDDLIDAFKDQAPNAGLFVWRRMDRRWRAPARGAVAASSIMSMCCPQLHAQSCSPIATIRLQQPIHAPMKRHRSGAGLTSKPTR